jgi:hypothetical protein
MILCHLHRSTAFRHEEHEDHEGPFDVGVRGTPTRTVLECERKTPPVIPRLAVRVPSPCVAACGGRRTAFSCPRSNNGNPKPS